MSRKERAATNGHRHAPRQTAPSDGDVQIKDSLYVAHRRLGWRDEKNQNE
jgi:hypothetical protein